MNYEQQREFGARGLYIIYFRKCLKVFQYTVVTDSPSFPSDFMATPVFKKHGVPSVKHWLNYLCSLLAILSKDLENFKTIRAVEMFKKK